MIHSMDRSGYFGASDTAKVVAKNRNTKTWKEFWNEKLGGATKSFRTPSTTAGTLWEHSILTAIDPSLDFDRTIVINTPRMLLRVNYDGNNANTIYEVKTHKSDKPFELTQAYWQQAQVEMYAWTYAHEHGTPDSHFQPVEKLDELYVVSYALHPDEIYNTDWIDEDDAYAGRLDVDRDRLRFNRIKYDKSWVKGEYLPALKELTKALRKGKQPW